MSLLLLEGREYLVFSRSFMNLFPPTSLADVLSFFKIVIRTRINATELHVRINVDVLATFVTMTLTIVDDIAFEFTAF